MANDEEGKKLNEEVLSITDNLKLCEDMSSLYYKQHFSDVTFILNGEKISAHKGILATRSEYFNSLFCRDKEQSDFTLPMNVSIQAFQKVLKYLYTGSVTIIPSDVELMLDVLELANKCFLKNLELAIAEKMPSVINMENVCSFLNQANSYGMKEVREACQTFMDENVLEILTNDRLQNLTQKSMVKLLERDTFSATEIDIFKSVAKWCKINDDVDNLVIKCVRFSLLSEKDMLLTVRPSKLVDDATLLNIWTEYFAEDKPKTSRRGPFLLEDTNLATSEHKCQVIAGTNTSFLLSGTVCDKKADISKCASHSIGDKNGITVRLGLRSYINHIHMKLWDENKTCYSYFIEVSSDGIKWETIIDYSLYRCRSYQKLYFDQKIAAQYIRIVGTHSSTDPEFVLVFFQTYFKIDVPNVINGMVCPTENVARVDQGAVLLEGYFGSGSTCISGYICHYLNEDNIIIQLAQPYLISYMKLQLYKPEAIFRYFIETSINKSDWKIAVDRRNEDCKSWQILYFKERPAVYIKITCTKSPYLDFVSHGLECYYKKSV